MNGLYYIHKYEIYLGYAGPEEGGQWYSQGEPTGFVFGPIPGEEGTYDQCRALNSLEAERAEREEAYDFTSVLSYLSKHFTYCVEETPQPTSYPVSKPHYE